MKPCRQNFDLVEDHDIDEVDVFVDISEQCVESLLMEL
jgi:hypothetical protein